MTLVMALSMALRRDFSHDSEHCSKNGLTRRVWQGWALPRRIYKACAHAADPLKGYIEIYIYPL